MRIGETTLVRRGLVAAYPTILRAVMQARQLRLTSLSARANINLVECILLADQPVPGTTQTPGVDDIDAVVAEATVLADNARTYGPSCALGVRAWLHGDSATAIRMIEEGLLRVEGEIKSVPWMGFSGLLRVVVDGVHPNEAFGPINLTGHHANWAARAFGTAMFNLRAGQPAQEALAEAEHYVRHAPYWRHLLRTVIAASAFKAGMTAAEGWLLEADSYCGVAAEQLLQRRARRALAEIGAKVPRTRASVPPHLARVGITARETEILRLVNAGFSNIEIAGRLFISTRTVETHISSMLRKTRTETRDQLPLSVEDQRSG
jgi:DNA-binding CsgD family transcriptional regulator